MRTLSILIAAGLLSVISCSHLTTRTACPITPDRWSGLESILSGRWPDFSPDTVVELWPQPITWGSEASGEQPRSGTATFSYLERVEANDCLCCDTFLFTDGPSQAGCVRRLSSVTLVRDFATRLEAIQLATRAVAVIGGAGARAQGTRYDDSHRAPASYDTDR